jgi:acyl-CoA carboxylase epsilon subunit
VSGPEPLLFVVKGDASAEEVAALAAVLQAMAAAAATGGEAERPPRPEWSSPARRLRAPLGAGPGAWRASALPR